MRALPGNLASIRNGNIDSFHSRFPDRDQKITRSRSIMVDIDIFPLGNMICKDQIEGFSASSKTWLCAWMF
jgi:hypothetical protein